MAEHKHLAFLILVPTVGSNAVSTQSGEGFTLSLATVDNLVSAKQLASDLRDQGVHAIELSAAFGENGLAAIRAVVGDNIDLGLVRYE
ncbi:hypothetical protein SAMN05216203_2046 [Marinobacter daqiaonensis]|uniref:Uncharacterized protein n=1 Tax=Marinobacter daqiaonensis TaxID=650891 RepID=A0A1I6IAT2_9GAMM|nr:DUF6506 family protein [Marinobacter daqiaonensis]SFR63793.1 hypothetical protein SAMN05216203_2046 [Marinobacter daqiaonensis]